MAGQSKTTTDHEVIKKWAEARGGQPAAVKNTESNGDPGLLRIDFPGYSGEGRLDHISWEEWFNKFDEKHLVFLYQDEKKDGEPSNFFKLVSEETEKARENERESRQQEREKEKSHKH